MSRFQPPKPGEIQTEPSAHGDVRVVKLDVSVEPVVEQYQFGKIRRAGERDYASVKAKYGPIAATDQDRPERSQRDRKFSINPLLRDPLAVEDEERRAIDERVEARIAAVIQETKDKARQDGYEEGLQKGYAAALANFQRENTERVESFQRLIGEMEQAKAEIFRANERFLIELVFQVARQVALRELKTDRDYVLRLCRGVIERLGVRENIRVRLHPDDMLSVPLLQEGLDKALGGLKNLQVEPSAQVELGGCLVESEWNAIDARIETQLRGLHDALVAAPSDPGEPGP
jgi:flagellar biosynthesis/type III secretory pathway protein FliH